MVERLQTALVPLIKLRFSDICTPVGIPAGVHCLKGAAIVNNTLISDRTWAEPMDSREIARYIEQTDGISKPWLLIQWRLQKLKERQSEIAPEAYRQELIELHQALMNLGEWWVGREDEVF